MKELNLEEIEDIRRSPDCANWSGLCWCWKLSEEFIREFKDKICWDKISLYQSLSEDFIKEFKNDVNWRNISRCQNLSRDFCFEFYDKVNWKILNYFKKALYKGYFDNAPRHVKLYIALNHRELIKYL